MKEFLRIQILKALSNLFGKADQSRSMIEESTNLFCAI